MLPSLLVLLPIIGTSLLHLCSCVQRPELELLTGNTQRSGGTFCPGQTAQLKCLFPEGKQSLEWYVNDFERPIPADYLADDLPGHTATTPFGNYTIVDIIKEEFYIGNYSCAVDIPNTKSDLLSNSVDVLFIDTEPEGIAATCTSSSDNSIAVAVNYTNGCRRETVVAANGMTCKVMLSMPTMTLCDCSTLRSNTSYNITAYSSGHVDSITCSTTMTGHGTLSVGSAEDTKLVYLVFLGVPALAVTGLGVVLGLLLYQYRKRQKGKNENQFESKAEEACHSGKVLQTSAKEKFDENPYMDRSPFESEVPEALLRSGSDESRESVNSTKPLLAQHQAVGCDNEVKYAVLDHGGPRSVPAPSPHEKVNYATIQPEQ